MSHLTRQFRPVRRVALPLAVLALLGVLTGCRAEPRAPAGPSPGSATVASSPVPSATPGADRTYQPVRDACAPLDQRVLTGALGPDAGNFGTPRSDDNSFAVFARCQRQYGTAGSRRLVSVEIMTVKHGTAQPYYQGMRRAQQQTETLIDIPGLGSGAYRYTDPDTGPHVVVYQANLYLSMSLIGRLASGNDPTRTATGLLEQAARQAMIRLTS